MLVRSVHQVFRQHQSLFCLALVSSILSRPCSATSSVLSHSSYSTMANPSDVDWSDGVFVINPPSKKTPESTLIWCHGLGDSYEGFSDLMEMISPHLPNTRIVIPNAPTRPITVNGGMKMPGWYDIIDMIGRHDPPSDSSSSAKREDLDGIRASSDKLRGLIAAERKLLGSNAGQVVLGGFSQGGAMSIYTGLRTTSPPLAAIMCCSGYVLDASSYESKELQGDLALDTPVWAFHGLADDVVPYKWAEAGMLGVLKNAGVTIDLHTESTLGHSLSNPEVSAIVNHLKATLY